MTPEKFEAYLIEIGGLENGHFPDRDPIISRHYCSCGDGWLQMIHDLISELIAAGWDKQICQIKEKFGGLRFYINAGSDEVWTIISNYESLSYKVCETCGEQGELRNDIGWYRTLCDKHYNEIKTEKEQNNKKN